MAQIENNDVLRIGVSLLFNAQSEIVNVYHCQVTAGGGVTYAAAVADIQEYVDDLYTLLEARMSTLMEGNSISLSNRTQDTVFGNISFGSWAGGTAGGEPTPLGVACLSWARTIYPRVQMRKYFGVFTEGDLTSSVWTTAAVTAANAALTYHVGTQTMTGGLQLVGIAYNHALNRRAGSVGVSGALEPVYQRRRRRGAGS